MTAPTPARTPGSSDSQVVARNFASDAGVPSRDAPAPRAQSKLPTFVQGRVLARRYFVDEVFETTPTSTFLRAHDLELERVVLIRLLQRAEAPELLRERGHGWFTRLDHPVSGSGILGTLGVGVLSGGWPMLVCQYWRGRSLEAFLRSGEAPNVLGIVQIARQVAQALDEAHRLGHTHGTLRSEDIWLRRQPEGGERAMLLGFQPGDSNEPSVDLVARDLEAFADLLSLMVASLLPLYRLAARRASLEDAQESGSITVIAGPLARVAARCQGTTPGRRYRSAAELASVLERVEAIALRLSAQQ
ncbi:MAG TPA: hypothetical protein VJU61_03500 [Polyangiaceae bacterium]|nr:hypothetical protein [Polyangiaceae bacterium]